MNLAETWYAHPAPSVQLPARYQAVQWDALPPSPVRTTAEQYLRACPVALEHGQGACWFGRSRQYKTVAAALVSRALVDTFRVPVTWVNVPSALAACERDRYSASTQARLAQWQDCPVLVLDDAFAVGTYGMTQLQAIAAARFDALLPTLWTGNHLLSSGAPPDEPWRALAPWGKSFLRRLRETGKGFTVFVQ